MLPLSCRCSSVRLLLHITSPFPLLSPSLSFGPPRFPLFFSVDSHSRRLGLSSYDISLADQTVIVKTSTVSYDDVLAKIKKTGKEVKSGEVVA